MGSSDPKSEPRDNLFRPHRVYSYSIVGCVNGPEEAWPKSTGLFAKRSPADKNRGSPASHNMRPRPAARKSKKKRQPTKGQPNMDARTTRRISQRDSPHRACIKTASLNEKPGRAAAVIACAAPPAQRSLMASLASHHCARSLSATTCAVPPAQALPRALFTAKLKTRSVPNRSPCALLPATSCFTRQFSLAGISLPSNEVNLRFRD